MINPDRFQEIPDAVSRNINELENFAIAKIAESIRRNNELSGTAEQLYDAIMRTRLFETDFFDALAVVSGKTLIEIENIFAGTVAEMHESDREAYELTKKEFVPYQKNEYLQQLTRAMSDQTKGTFTNLTQTRSLGFVDKRGKFVGLKDYLQRSLQQTQFNITAGVESYDQAIKRIVGEMVNSGLRHFDYESGHRDRTEVAVRRAILTGIAQTAGQVSKYNTVQLEARHVQVSRHIGARTGNGLGDIADHSAWQGGIYYLSDDFFIEFANGQIPPLSEVTETYLNFIEICGYGDGNGINGWNCRHSWSLFFPQYQKPFYTAEQLKKMTEEEAIKKPFTYIDGRGNKVTKEFDVFDASQEMRRRERLIRRYRALAHGYKAGGNMDEYHAAKAQITKHRAEYERFIEEMNKPPTPDGFRFIPQWERIFVDNLGRV